MSARGFLLVSGLLAGPLVLGAASPARGDQGDYDGDGTVNLADFAAFPGCLGGPGTGLGDGCGPFDFDSDLDVDLVDFAGFQLVFGTSPGVVIETVTVGNPGNPGELSGAGAGGFGPDRICGSVDHTYDIGKHEVTAGQYTAFLNAVAATDPYDLYNTNMSSSTYGCKIARSGSPGTYVYSVAEDWANRPVNYVSWGDAARFANWLHNGQRTGAQDLSTTEDGSYHLNGAISVTALQAVVRKADATWVIPSEDEWYKAAYHKNDGPTGSFFDYPIGSDSVPNNDLIEPDPGNNATFRDYWDGSYTIGSPYWRTEIGAHENCESPYGTFDQGGNVEEWNEAIILAKGRGVRGGSFEAFDGRLRAINRYFLYPTDESCFFGFRVCEVP